MTPGAAPRRGKVLVLGKDTRAFLAVIRSLGRRGLDVHVAWCDRRAPAARSRYVGTRHELPSPSPHDTRWRDGLLDLLAREDFDLVVPCSDPAILPLQGHTAAFAPFLGAIYLLDDHVFRIVFDKLESWALARSLGIPVARRVRVRSVDDLAPALASFAFPMVVKPRASFTMDRLGRKHHVRWARSPDELASLVQALLPWGDVAVEERVAGHGAGVEVLAHEGRVLAAFQHVRIHEPPSGGGSSYRRSSALDPALLGATQTYLAALRYTGVAMLEFRIDPAAGTWAFIEINARFWGSLPLAVAAGADFPWYLYQMWVQGRRQFPQGYRTGVYCRNLVNDVRWMTKSWRGRGDATSPRVPRRRILTDLLPLVTLREHSDTFVRDDPRPGFAELWEGARRLAATMRVRPWRRGRGAEAARQALGEARRVLFLCKGNIYRSPFAHHLAARLFPPGVQVASCGMHPETGRACPAEAVGVAAEMGVDLRDHRSRDLSAGLLREADVVFVFDEDNYRALRERHAWAMARVHFLGILGDQPGVGIRDPEGGGPAAVRDVYEAIRRSVTAAARCLPVAERRVPIAVRPPLGAAGAREQP